MESATITKVTLRKEKLRSGKLSLYLDLSAIKPDYQAFIVSTPNFAPKNAKLGVFIYS